MLKKTAAVLAAALAIAVGGAGAAFADNGADDPAGQHQEHKNGEKRHHHGKHGQRHHQKGDDHGGHGNDDGPNHS
jgi:Spy/CpxP family protein refolding chaperone